MGGQDLPGFLRPKQKYTHSLQGIRATLPPGPLSFVVGVDLSIWMVSALKSKEAVEQFHAKPPVPVTAVVDYIQKRVDILEEHGAHLIFVIDGAYHVMKDDEHSRRSKPLIEKQKRLDAILDPDTREVPPGTLNEVEGLRKNLTKPREDVLHLIIEFAKQRGIPVVGAPFESDWQLACLANQGIIDFALTTDSDIPTCGTAETIDRLSLGGKFCLIDRETLLKEKLPKDLKTQCTWTLHDLRSMSCFLGNDYVQRIEGKGEKAIAKFMPRWVGASEDEKDDLLIEHCNGDEQWMDRRKKAMQLFEVGPAFVVKSMSTGPSNLRVAFFSGQYHVFLGSLDGKIHEEEAEEGFWTVPSEDGSGYEKRVGFIPSEHLVEKWKEEDAQLDPGELYKDLLTVKKWSRTGRATRGIDDLHDEEGRRLLHGSEINFESDPLEYIPDTRLILWLTVRGIRKAFNSRTRILDCVKQIRALGTIPAPLPAMLMRGAAGYVSFELLSPANGGSVSWRIKDDALEFIRNPGYVPAMNDDLFTRLFGKRNSSRARVLDHIKGGSLDLSHVKVTLDLKDNLHPDKNLLVLQYTCAPSQKVSDKNSKPKFYEIRLVFEVGANGSTARYLPPPLSRCSCPNGAFQCGHVGTGYCWIYVVQNSECDYETMVSLLPSPIHKVTSMLIPVSTAFPKRISVDAERERTIARSMKALKKSQAQEDEDEPCEAVCDDAAASTGTLDTAGTEDDNDYLLDDESDEENDSMDADNNEEEFEPWDYESTFGVPDVSSSDATLVCVEMDKWLAEMDCSLETRGRAQKFAIDAIRTETERKAEPNTDEVYVKKQLVRHERLLSLYSGDDPEEPDMMLVYLLETKEKRDAKLQEMNDLQVDLKSRIRLRRK